jgi:hypothetical protein
MLMVGGRCGPDKSGVPPRLVGGPLCQQVGHSSGAFLKMMLRWHGEQLSVQATQRSVLGLHGKRFIDKNVRWRSGRPARGQRDFPSVSKHRDLGTLIGGCCR